MRIDRVVLLLLCVLHLGTALPALAIQRVGYLYPNGPGDRTQHRTVPGPAWQAVDEHPNDGDLTYIFARTADGFESHTDFALQDPTAAMVTILSVRCEAWAKEIATVENQCTGVYLRFPSGSSSASAPESPSAAASGLCDPLTGTNYVRLDSGSAQNITRSDVARAQCSVSFICNGISACAHVAAESRITEVRLRVDYDDGIPTPTPSPTRTPTPTPTPGGICGGPLNLQCPQGQMCVGGTSLITGTCRIPTPTPTATPTPAPNLSLMITSPADGAGIGADHTLVRGVYSGPANTGVTVNGAPAFTRNGAFAANHVLLEAGSNTITARASARDGSSATHQITVTGAGAPPPLLFGAKPTAGVVPLTVGFEFLLASGAEVQSARVDFDGDGAFDSDLPAGAREFTNTYGAPGLYVVKLEVVDDQNSTLQAELAIDARTEQELDVVLVSTWNGMIDALEAGDIDRAVTYITLQKQAAYRQRFAALDVPLASISQLLSRGVTRVQLQGRRAEYEIARVEGGKTYSYPVIFAQDDDGVWRIRGF